ncbi:MAG: hypothetical protein DRG78_13635 [Epsilonproteobacteria bacterium]|nr:MAG: hypothetical protein DRG78_13635 [Campylobacterota bacterium]
MNEYMLSKIKNNIYELRKVFISGNYIDDCNLDLLVQNFMLLQEIMASDVELFKVNKYLRILEKETEYFLAKYHRVI